MSLGLMRPCLDCGEPSESSRCEAHRPDHPRQRQSPDARGYDAAWRRLSKRARRLQPWCSDAHLGACRGPLTTDHLPAAHAAQASGRTVTLRMVEVVCQGHNDARGSSRPGTTRYEEWERSDAR